jgi:hypothetical protein
MLFVCEHWDAPREDPCPLGCNSPGPISEPFRGDLIRRDFVDGAFAQARANGNPDVREVIAYNRGSTPWQATPPGVW